MSRGLHPHNPFAHGYDLQALTAIEPRLTPFLRTTPDQRLTLDFGEPAAVRWLNAALLKHQYQLEYPLPEGVLCPAVPGRLDYLLRARDFLASLQHGRLPKTRHFQLLDIGCGANLIYSLLAAKACHYRVIATDIEASSLAIAAQLLQINQLEAAIELRHQPNASHIFTGVIKPGEQIDLTVCNPPFHRSAADAAAGTARKQRNLGRQQQQQQLNFAGQANELWCDGGELAFVSRMITESQQWGQQVAWFSTLVSQQQHVRPLQQLLQKHACPLSHWLPMQQGNKTSRVLLWSWLTPAQQQLWQQYRW